LDEIRPGTVRPMMKPEKIRLLLVAGKDSPLPVLPMEWEEGDKPALDAVRQPGRRHPFPAAFAPSSVGDGGRTLRQRAQKPRAGRAVADRARSRIYP
jgi:hypothetical protein